jgi:hypothetical protein
MPEWIDSPAEVLTLLSILGVVLAGLTWMIRAQIAQMKELKPNHGSSLRDAIDRIERSQREMTKDIRELRTQHGEINERLFNSVGKVHGRLDEHIHDHMMGNT